MKRVVFPFYVFILFGMGLLHWTTESNAGYQYIFNGLNFSPYMDGQDPNIGSQISQAQLTDRMRIIQPYTKWIRTFGSTHGLEYSGAVAHSMGLKAALGAWISSQLDANETEINNLIASAKRGEADMLIVGSEVLRRSELSEFKLIEYINRVKQALPGIPVAYAEIYNEIINHPNIVAASDVILVNIYPYWEQIPIDQALTALNDRYQQVKAIAGNKHVIISETGWPSAGSSQGTAVPSQQNANLYLINFALWAQFNSVDYFYFEAFDETWKAAVEGAQGAHWGVWDKTGQLKRDTPTTLVAAVLPASRAVTKNSTATAFATIINGSSTNSVSGCSISLPKVTPASFTYQTTNPVTNVVTGPPNTPVTLAPRASQSFVFSMTPSGTFSQTDIPLIFSCASGELVSAISGVNTFLLTASTQPTPDIIAQVATMSNDGIVRSVGAVGGAFSVATANVGVAGDVVASVDTGSASVPANFTICQTDAGANCLQTAATSVATSFAANQTGTFSVFVNANGADIPLDPAKTRVFVRFRSPGGASFGATSVAILAKK